MDVSEAAGRLREFAESWGIAGFTLLMGAIATAAAVSSARSARQALNREGPIIEVKPLADEPWQGWTTITLHITNPAPAEMMIDRIAVGRFARGRIEMAGPLTVELPETSRNYLTRRATGRTYRAFPETAPTQVHGRRVLDGLSIRVLPKSQKRTSVNIICPAGNVVPARLSIAYRWLDKRQRRMTAQAHI